MATGPMTLGCLSPCRCRPSSLEVQMKVDVTAIATWIDTGKKTTDRASLKIDVYLH